MLWYNSFRTHGHLLARRHLRPLDECGAEGVRWHVQGICHVYVSLEAAPVVVGRSILVITWHLLSGPEATSLTFRTSAQ
jgi:hypothetical protein